MHIAPVPPDISPIGAAVAAVTTQIVPVLTDVARFRSRRGRITRSHVLPPLARVLSNVAPIAPRIAAIVAQVAPVAACFLAISGRIAWLLGDGRCGNAERQREQCGDECPVLHGGPRKGL